MSRLISRWRAGVLYFCIVFAVLLLIRGSASALPPTTQSDSLYKSDQGPWTVAVRDEDWIDAKRNRTVPVRIYLPSKSADQSTRPIVILSHGWGGSRITYRYFAEHLAGWGYLVIAPTHLGSDTSSIAFRTQPAGGSSTAYKRETLMQSIDDPENLRNRPLDISFIIDEIPRHKDLGAIADLDHIGVAGHSFGAYTAMAIGGMLVDLPDGKKQSFRDPRVKAVLPMSPEGPGTMGISPGAWDRFSAPVLFLTGTRDYGSNMRSALWRHEAYSAIHTAPEWIAIIIDGTHMTFAIPQKHEAMINSLGMAFFDAQVLHDPKAIEWMDAFFSTKHSECTVDHQG